MQINSSVSDKKKQKKNKLYQKCHFTNKVPFLFTVDFLLVLSCSIFSNDISCIHFPEHQTAADHELLSKETESWVAWPWLVTWPNSVLLIGWGPKFHQHRDRIGNTWWPSDAIWQHKTWPALVQVMAYCLIALSHYLNKCWLIITKAQWHSSDAAVS